MKKRFLKVTVFIFIALFVVNTAQAQCAICTKSAQQLGEKPAKALNAGIIYLAAAPLVMMGFIGYRWYKHNR